MKKLLIMVSATAALAACPPAWAQTTEAGDEERRVVLNREQAEFARRQVEENTAAQRAYDDAVSARKLQISAQEQEYARILAEHRRAMNQWRADVAACEGGDRTKCAKPSN